MEFIFAIVLIAIMKLVSEFIPTKLKIYTIKFEQIDGYDYEEYQKRYVEDISKAMGLPPHMFDRAISPDKNSFR